MLTGFEKITEDLNQYEEHEVLPLIVAGLRSKIGKDKAITGTDICTKMNASGRLKEYKLNPVKLRKIISAIRIHNFLPMVCSNSRGYYVADTAQELDDCLQSLRERLNQQQRVVDALEQQGKINQLRKAFHG
jgi:hypothetical protein